jgi:hypothetical protein
LLAGGSFVLNSWWPVFSTDWAISASTVLPGWLETVSWAAILWIGLHAWRRHDTWGWRLLLLVGALALFDRVPGYFLGIYSNSIALSPNMDLWENIREQYFWLKVVGADLEIFGVLVVLASGLGLRMPGGAQRASAIPDDDSDAITGDEFGVIPRGDSGAGDRGESGAGAPPTSGVATT